MINLSEKRKGKKKAKKEKRLKGEEAEKTKSKKFHRRLVSLFCFCFKSQERNDENNEMEQSTRQQLRKTQLTLKIFLKDNVLLY